MKELNVKRNHKDGAFRALFKDTEELRKLYNALSDSNYSKGTEIKIVTIEDVLLGDMKNDLAFIIDNKLIILIEHQSTINPNMPLRMLCYIARQYEKLAFTNRIYSTRLVQIPTPELYVFYNGKEDQPLESELKLSDTYISKCDKISLEAVVKVINVNYEKGARILKKCQTLREYSEFIYITRKLMKETGELHTAIEESIRICREKGILDEFLKRNGGDIVSFLFEELTREECEAIREEDGYMRGLEEGQLKEKHDVARNMIDMGMDTEIIAKATGLAEEEIANLSR